LNRFESIEKFRANNKIDVTMQSKLDQYKDQSYEQTFLNLRWMILSHLTKIGFMITDNGQLSLPNDKSYVRNAHQAAVSISIKKYRRMIEKNESQFIDKYLIDGKSLDVTEIEPIFVPVSKENTNLFNWVKLHWSVPISAGYGRRLRYIVKDSTNGAVMGIIGLADPVFGLKDRDTSYRVDKTSKN
jgi:hypothetical protein